MGHARTVSCFHSCDRPERATQDPSACVCFATFLDGPFPFCQNCHEQRLFDTDIITVKLYDLSIDFMSPGSCATFISVGYILFDSLFCLGLTWHLLSIEVCGMQLPWNGNEYVLSRIYSATLCLPSLLSSPRTTKSLRVHKCNFRGCLFRRKLQCLRFNQRKLSASSIRDP